MKQVLGWTKLLMGGGRRKTQTSAVILCVLCMKGKGQGIRIKCPESLPCNTVGEPISERHQMS